MRLRGNGQAINDGVTHFTNWLDEFLIRSAGLMIMVGMMAGTLDVFTTVGLIKLSWFTLVWAGVQSVAIDGLFFAVWRKIRRQWKTVARKRSLIPLIAVGTTLALVAALISATLSYQQLNGSSDVATAMATLGIDKTLFSYVRSFLVVIVAILIVLVIDDTEEPQVTATALFQATPIAHVQIAQATVPQIAQTPTALLREHEATGYEEQNTKERAMALPQQASSLNHSLDTLTHSPASIARHEGHSPSMPDDENPQTVADSRALHRQASPYPVAHSPATHAQASRASNQSRSSQEPGYIAVDDGTTVAVANGEGATMIATGSHRERIKQAMLDAIRKGEEATYNEIAEAASVGYSTVKKHAAAIEQEIAPSEIAGHDKLEKALDLLQQNPNLTDEELAPLLGLRRPLSARFWRLKAKELLERNASTQ